LVTYTYILKKIHLSEISVKCNKDYNVQSDESQRGHCTNERRLRKREKKVRCDLRIKTTAEDGERGQQ